jgi:hypothetical protein
VALNTIYYTQCLSGFGIRRETSHVQAVVEYVQTGGSLRRIPPDAQVDGYEVRTAVYALQSLHRRRLLAPASAAHLEKLRDWRWWPSDRRRKGETAHTIRALKKFVDGGGHAGAIPRGVLVDGVKLSRAASDLRSRHRRGDLTREAVCALEALRGWRWDARRAACSSASPDYGKAAGRRPHSEIFDLLAGFIAREGHARVPRFHVEGGFRLGALVHLQRREYRKGRVPAARATRLESLTGWPWEPMRFRAETLQQLDTVDGVLAVLRECVGEVGTAAGIGGDTRWRGAPLGAAVETIRRRHAFGELSEAIAAAFSAVTGWDWTPEDRFARYLVALRRFADRAGHARVPGRHREGVLALGRWVQGVRGRFRSGSLPKREAALLETVPGWAWQVRPVQRVREARIPLVFVDTP